MSSGFMRIGKLPFSLSSAMATLNNADFPVPLCPTTSDALSDASALVTY